jgi:CheY-like chemotaxis protein
MIAEQVSVPKILLVDDEVKPLELRAQIMKLHGFSVLTANGPMKALAIMKQAAFEKVQVAILDYNMPGMNGCMLADQLRSRFPNVRTILYSGAVDIPSREMTSVDVLISKSDGILTLLSQVMQFVRVPAESPVASSALSNAYSVGR